MTHYLQGSADCAGASSGNPVINKEGEVVGMVTGGSGIKTTDFYFPTTKIQYVLNCLRVGMSVQRGTIQCTWLLKTRAECDALGVSQEIIEKYSLSKFGLLSADQVLPEGPSHGNVQAGDILLQASHSKFESLVELEALLDRTVGTRVQFRLWRSGEEFECDLHVQDLFTIAPQQIVEWSGGIFHDMQLHQARRFHVPVKGLVLARSGTWGWTRRMVLITAVENRQTPDTNSFIDAVKGIPGIY